MRCEACGEKTEVKDSRQYFDEKFEMYYVERRHRCKECDHLFVSVEIPQDIWQQLSRNGS